MNAKLFVSLWALSTVAFAEGDVNQAKEPAKEVAKESVKSAPVHFNKEQVDEIKRIVAETMTENPEHVVKAIQTFGEQEQLKQIKEMDDAINKQKDKLIAQTGAVLLGEKGAATKLIVFLDPNCPHCRKFDKILQEVEKDHGKFEIVYRLLPILGEKSVEATKVLLAAANLDHSKFVKALEKVAVSQDHLDKEKTLQIVKDVGFDAKAIEDKMGSEEVKKALDTNAQLAQDINLQGTPTSILSNKESIKLITPSDKKSLEGFLAGANEGAAKQA